MTHLTREQLARWLEEGRPADRERIVAHLAECNECGALYGEVIDAQPLLVSEAAGAPADVIARGYRAYRRPRGHFGRLFPSRLLIAYGAAAILLVAVLVPVLRESTRPRTPDPTRIRGSAVQPLAPIGQVDPPVQFRWASPVEAARFRVEIRDEEQRVLFILSTDGERVDLPPDRLAGLTPGRSYWWEVAALDAAGEPIMRAPRRSSLGATVDGQRRRPSPPPAVAA